MIGSAWDLAQEKGVDIGRTYDCAGGRLRALEVRYFFGNNQVKAWNLDLDKVEWFSMAEWWKLIPVICAEEVSKL